MLSIQKFSSEMRIYNNFKRRVQKSANDLRTRFFRQESSYSRRDTRPKYKSRSESHTREFDRLQVALRESERENGELKVEIEKLLHRSFDQSLESTMHQTISHLREENKILSKRNHENHLLIDDLEKNYEELRHEHRVLKSEMERDFVECPGLSCRKKFRTNQLLKRHLRFDCRGAQTIPETEASGSRDRSMESLTPETGAGAGERASMKRAGGTRGGSGH